MAPSRGLAHPIMGCGIGFHPDQAGPELRRRVEERPSPHRLAPEWAPSAPTTSSWNTDLAKSRPIVATAPRLHDLAFYAALRSAILAYISPPYGRYARHPWS